MAILRVFLFGVPRFERAGELLQIPRRKAVALLAYLAATSQAHSRDALATLFWPENDQASARANLRRDLSRLKGALGEQALVIEREQVALNPQAGLWIDVGVFQSKLAEANQHDLAQHEDGAEVCAACLAAWTEAVEIYTGDFMAGFSLPDSLAFDEWQFFQAESLRQLLANALQRLIGWHSMQGKYEKGIEYARRWLGLDHLHEPAHRQLMQFYAWSGQQAAALRQYQECVRLLREELGVEPEAETVTLYHAIRTRQLTQPDAIQIVATAPPGEDAWVEADEQEMLAIAKPASPGFGPDSGMEQQIRFCTSADGVRIAYAIVGRGPVLVKAANWLSHLEFDWNSPVWRHWLSGLSRQHTLVRYDERGCGLSDWEVEEFSINAWVQDLETVADTLGLDRFPLLGISQGGPVAIAYAIRHPEKVSHLILYGTYSRGRLKRDYSPEQIKMGETMLSLFEVAWGKDNPAFRQFFTTLFMPGATPEQMHWFNDLQRVSTSPEVAARLERAFYQVDVSDLAPRISAPTLILHATNDALVPLEEARRLAALIPSARFVPLQGQNHLLLEDEPAWQRFLAEIHRFLGGETDDYFSTL